MMENPWDGLSKDATEFVAPVDIEYLQEYSRRRTAQKDDFRLVTDVVPEPWCGPMLNARVLILSGNPHWDERDLSLPSFAHLKMWENLSGVEPLFWLDSRLQGTSGGNWYRLKLLKDVLKECADEVVAQRLSLVDFVGYRSHRWDHSLRPHSQKFTAWAVEGAVQRGAIIVVSRGRRLWEELVPSLASYPRVFTNSSAQNVRLSPNNTGLSEFESIIAELS
jgi:hypothetical protein